MRVLRTGIPAAGIAAGTAFVLERRVSAAPSAATGDPAAETARFHAALAQAKTELGILAAENDIFAAHLEMADDPMLAEQVEERISKHGFSAERALDEACEEVCGMLAALDDEYLGGRTDDVRDVCGRIRRILTGETAENPFAGLAPGTIVVAEELTPSDTALMDFSRIAGVVTARGSVTSHVCIIARAKGIAAIVGASECMLEIKTGDKLIINGETGEIIVAPDTATERRYRALSASRKRHGEHCLKGAHTPAVTRGGRRIAVLGNAGSVAEVRAALDAGAEGIGLFRSEFLYMQSRGGFPGEQTQFEAYRHAAELCGERPLVIRTLDIGGDKALPYMDFGHEENPFLGWRAVERLPGIECLAADPDVYENVLHDVLRPVSLQEETGVSHQRRIITAAHLVESLAAAVADRRREPGVVCRNGFHVYKDTQILRIRHPAPGFFTVLHKTTAPEHIAVFRRRSSQRMQGVSS